MPPRATLTLNALKPAALSKRQFLSQSSHLGSLPTSSGPYAIWQSIPLISFSPPDFMNAANPSAAFASHIFFARNPDMTPAKSLARSGRSCESRERSFSCVFAFSLSPIGSTLPPRALKRLTASFSKAGHFFFPATGTKSLARERILSSSSDAPTSNVASPHSSSRPAKECEHRSDTATTASYGFSNTERPDTDQFCDLSLSRKNETIISFTFSHPETVPSSLMQRLRLTVTVFVPGAPTSNGTT